MASCPGLAEVAGFSAAAARCRAERPRAADLLRGEPFQGPFLTLLGSLGSLLALGPQRAAFLSTLPAALRQFPPGAVAASAAPRLLAPRCLLLPGVAETVLPPLLAPAALLPPPLWQRTIPPLLPALLRLRHRA